MLFGNLRRLLRRERNERNPIVQHEGRARRQLSDENERRVRGVRFGVQGVAGVCSDLWNGGHNFEDCVHEGLRFGGWAGGLPKPKMAPKRFRKQPLPRSLYCPNQKRFPRGVAAQNLPVPQL
jgi:hypothetical protein